MPNMEKVLKGLECCTFILGKRKCNECPYQKELPDNGCYQLQDDFHALLKEQDRLITEARNEGYNEGYNEAYHSYCVEVAEEDQELRRILPYSVVQCEDCENAGPAYFTDEGEMLYDCNKTECCKRRSVK